MSNQSKNTALWMGDVTPDMDENFIISAFAQVGEPVMKVKIMNTGKAPHLGPSTRYCFVDFPDYAGALRALQRLNGTFIPGMPGRRFKLNTSTRDQNSIADHSLYVGGLTSDVEEPALCAFFQFRYPSVYAARVIIDNKGVHRGYGFVRFADETEYNRALTEMHNARGLGQTPLRVSTAIVRRPDGTVATPGSNANQLNIDHQPHGEGGDTNQQYNASLQYGPPTGHEMQVENNPDELHDRIAEMEDYETLEDPGLEINIRKENREFIDSSESFFTALEVSRWQPLDNIMSEIPD